MKNLKRKLIATFTVMMFALLATIGTTYAYWNYFVHTESSITVEVGVADRIVVAINTTGAGALVPAGQSTGAEVESIVLTYDVSVTQGAVDSGITTLSVTTANESTALVNISVSAPTTLTVANQTVTVTVTLDSPADQAAYDALIAAGITFDLVFTIA